MKKRLFLILLLPVFLFPGCKDFLDIVPEEDMTTLNSIFETRDQADAWLKSCYIFLQDPVPSFSSNPAFSGSDELVTGVYLGTTLDGLNIRSGLQNSLDPYGDLWTHYMENGNGRDDFYTGINLCNVFIEKIDQVYNMEDSEKREWKAEVKALKAYMYFELIRRYGPIILVPENIDPNVDVSEMRIPRSHVDTCFAAVVQLCDEAARDLRPFNQKESSRRTYFCQEAALALKARALLYQASDLFNGNPDYTNFRNRIGEPLFSTEKDPEKWRRAAEAADTAIQVCLLNHRELVNNQVAATDLQSYMKNIEQSTATFNYTNSEILFVVKKGTQNYDFYPYTMPDITTDPNHLLEGTCVSPSMKMVEMFYTKNGLPIDQDPTWGGGNPYGQTEETDPYYTDVVALNEPIPVLHTQREPRFYASIAADRCYWRLGGTVNHNYKVEAYQGETFGLKERRVNYDPNIPQNLSGYWVKKWSASSAELYNYQNSYQALGEDPFPVIRMTELYLIAAEALNEYLDAPNQKVYDYLNVVRQRAGIPNVEESWAMARDKNKVTTKAGMRDIIRQEWNIEFMFEGHRFWNVRRWKIAHVELNESLRGWNVVGDDYNTFYNNGRGPVIVQSSNRFVAPRDYFFPLNSEEIQISGCVQNLGW